MEFHVRKMRNTEFKTLDDMLRRDAAGQLCHFAVEGERGTHAAGLSRQQALDVIERMSELAAA